MSRGDNCQWSYREGPSPFKFSKLNGKPPEKMIGRDKSPIFSYANSLRRGCVIGGIVYTGDEFEELDGRYIFGDHNSGEIFSLSLSKSDNSHVRRIISGNSVVEVHPV